ncbi:putative signal transducing protein [Flavisolibacter tropicus]|uniref:putative signal transducing protein n=1 Tax=Flavisolibacter tropicus TaxID=1492898 RepID=UPI0009020459
MQPLLFMQEIEVLCIMKFVPVQVYQNYVDAHIIKGRLEEAGIDCWLKDEHTVTTYLDQCGRRYQTNGIRRTTK